MDRQLVLTKYWWLETPEFTGITINGACWRSGLATIVACGPTGPRDTLLHNAALYSLIFMAFITQCRTVAISCSITVTVITGLLTIIISVDIPSTHVATGMTTIPYILLHPGSVCYPLISSLSPMAAELQKGNASPALVNCVAQCAEICRTQSYKCMQRNTAPWSINQMTLMACWDEWQVRVESSVFWRRAAAQNYPFLVHIWYCGLFGSNVLIL